MHHVGDGYVDRRDHVCADGSGASRRSSPPGQKSANAYFIRLRIYIGAPSKSMPSVANAAVAVSIRPLVAIAQGISACVRFTGPGRGWMLAERRL